MQVPMLDKLKGIEERFTELERRISDPAVMANNREYAQLARERASLQEVIVAIREYRHTLNDVAEHRAVLEGDDEDLRELAKGELPMLQKRQAELEERIKALITPRDPNDDRKVLREIRAGTGGEEASLFASELFRMYTRYAERHRWKVESLSLSTTGLGGIKEVIALIAGRGAYSRLKFEGGVHRVQRVPTTESSGRIHTSAVTVAVMPEADEVEVNINEEKDLRIDVMRASGPGGQSVNTTDSAVRITPLPSGLVVIQQDEKSQHKNKARAMKVLRARLYEMERQALAATRAADRKSQVGSGDRSEPIRTYNFPQGRVTDHRIGLTLYKIDKIMSGEALDEIIDSLTAADRATKLSMAAA